MGHAWSYDDKGTVDAEGQSGDRCIWPSGLGPEGKAGIGLKGNLGL